MAASPTPPLQHIAAAHGASGDLLGSDAPAGSGPRFLELQGRPSPPSSLTALDDRLGESDLVLVHVVDPDAGHSTLHTMRHLAFRC